ncbi:MAG: metallophosphoesterase [Clostridia bacterium]|nr:metallophosphoesterase [Clostridia bacterium]
MKNFTTKLVSGIIVTAALLTSVGCGGGAHKHDFSIKNLSEQYFAGEATCCKAASYYYTCECGEISEEVFYVGAMLSHDFSAEVVSSEYLKQEATCQKGAEYYKSCVMCGNRTYKTFFTDELGNHSYVEENPDGKYLKAEATHSSAPEYYKSCVCGAVGTETFFYGETLKEYSKEEKVPYTPTSLTVTLYDTASLTYGFTYNTSSEPLRPVIQIATGTSLTDYKEYPATVEKASSYATSGTPSENTSPDDENIEYYIVKAEVPLTVNTTYTYRAYDKYVDIGTELSTFTTSDPTATKFSFAHVSDSQMSTSQGTAFANVLSKVVPNNDFILHTGDVVEYSKYEYQWTDMLHTNFEYLSKIPMMAISGNHETTYRNGANETYKHFHNNIPQQNTLSGYYYSFTYGNAKFIMLNTNRLIGNKLTADQYDWLVDELENNTATWTFVALHNPLYSAGEWGSNPEKNSISLTLQEQLQGIFAEYGVDVVLQGHDHLVSRTLPINANGETVQESFKTIDGVSYSIDPHGVLYVMNGPAGTQTRTPNENYDPSLYKYALGSKSCSWANFSIDGNKLTVNAQYADGDHIKTYQTWGIVKENA